MLDALEPEREPERPDPGTPLYTQLKDLIRRRIDTGEWPEDHRVPSEKELVEQQGVSRMTANRALRELASEGLVVRIRGKGSFVAPRKRSSMFQTVANIADEIRFRGGHHAVEIISLQAEICGPDLAEALESAVGAVVFHTCLSTRKTISLSKSKTDM